MNEIDELEKVADKFVAHHHEHHLIEDALRKQLEDLKQRDAAIVEVITAMYDQVHEERDALQAKLDELKNVIKALITVLPGRKDLPPKERAVSNALDEWLIREHGIFESWASPDDFIEFLAKQGYLVLSNKEDDEITALRKQLEIAMEAIDTIISPDSAFASSKYIAREAKAEINRIGGKNERRIETVPVLRE